MLFVYINTTTKKYIEFSYYEKGIENARRPIDIFLESIISGFELKLPKELLYELDDKEIDMFLLAKFSKNIIENLKSMIYIVRENKKIKDQYGNEYAVEYENDKYTYVSNGYGEDFRIFYLETGEIAPDGIINAERLQPARI